MPYMSDEKRERRNKIILSVVIVGIMVLSSFGFVLDYAGSSGGQTERVGSDYGSLTFKLSGQTVVATIKGQVMQFGYFPSSLTSINTSADVAAAMRQPVIYITSDPSDPYAQAIDETDLRFSEYLPVITQGSLIPAFTNVTLYNRPGITCANATAAVPVLYMKYGNDTAITMQDNCIIAEARTPSDIIALADKLLFVTLGVQHA